MLTRHLNRLGIQQEGDELAQQKQNSGAR
uniref:Uncharacterized protein n=1 Tax=Arundo donax TaxID=35708 RepID=A0A0A9B710_ARUDO